MPELNVKTTVKFTSWSVPSFVRQENKGSTLSIHLKETEQEVIDALAQDWLERLYVSAGKTNPFRRTAYR